MVPFTKLVRTLEKEHLGREEVGLGNRMKFHFEMPERSKYESWIGS